ncbi:MAG: hypothetical protein ORN53_06190, partial [Crocinitomicaceae bacterium]|nr:hypothetical protein [Crocinitomicaceae bacterium]
AIDENGYVIPGKSLIVPLTKNIHRVKLPQDFIQGTEKVGMTISATDPMKSGGHGFGLFSAEVVSSNHEQFGFEMAEISFDD